MAEKSRILFTRQGFRRGVTAMLPVAAGLSVFGLALGLAAAQKGLSTVELGLMSALVFAGASQMLAVELWQHPVPLATLAVATVIINLRYLMMTAALAPWLGPVGTGRAYGSLFFTADENWALSMAEMRRGGTDAAFHIGAGMTLYVVWLLTTILGHLSGAAIPQPERFGLDFVAVATFLALLVPMWTGRRDLPPWLIAAVTATAAHAVLPGTWYLIAGGLAGSLYGAWRDVR